MKTVLWERGDFFIGSLEGLSIQQHPGCVWEHLLLQGVDHFSCVSTPALGQSPWEWLHAPIGVFTITVLFAGVNLGIKMREKHFEWQS